MFSLKVINAKTITTWMDSSEETPGKLTALFQTNKWWNNKKEQLAAIIASKKKLKNSKNKMPPQNKTKPLYH